jgi:hypothetical protein
VKNRFKFSNSPQRENLVRKSGLVSGRGGLPESQSNGCFATEMKRLSPSQRPEPARKISGMLNLSMSLAYFFCGCFLLIHPSGGKIIGPEYILVVGCALVVYGCFRGYRAFLQLSPSKRIKS